MQIFIEIRPLGRKLCHFENLVIFPFRKCSKASVPTDAEFLHALTYRIDPENILSSCKSADRRQSYDPNTDFRSKNVGPISEGFWKFFGFQGIKYIEFN